MFKVLQFIDVPGGKFGPPHVYHLVRSIEPGMTGVYAIVHCPRADTNPRVLHIATVRDLDSENPALQITTPLGITGVENILKLMKLYRDKGAISDGKEYEHCRGLIAHMDHDAEQKALYKALGD